MSQSIKQLYGDKLWASDGEIGHVSDFYFNDDSWVVRYVVAETGTWLTGRQVLLAPHAFGALHQAGKLVLINLTKKQIESSPSIEIHKPISRQYEEEYYKYYGWPTYWEGNGLWGMNAFPVSELPDEPILSEKAVRAGTQKERPDFHLRGTRSVEGYHLQAKDGAMGHVTDFLMDPRTWEIRGLVIKTGSWFSGQEVEIPVKQVIGISYEESTVFVELTCEDVEQSSAPDLVGSQVT
jgi:uncharacterized protein YrrD